MSGHDHRGAPGVPQGTAPAGIARETELVRRLAALPDLAPAALRTEWRRLYRTQPPRLSRDLLVRALTYRIQELAHGPLGTAAQRRLAALAAAPHTDGPAASDPVPKLRPGTRLVREWNGRTHTITVMEDGFAYAGQTYRSLTAIARVITGAHWSGPRFFGLARHRRQDGQPGIGSEAAEASATENADG